MIWLDTFWSLALDAPHPTLEACAHPPPPGLPGYELCFREWAHCVWPFVYLTHTGYGGASVVTGFSSVSLNAAQDRKDNIPDRNFTSFKNTVSSQRFQNAFRSIGAPHSPLVYSLRSKFIIPIVNAPRENEAESLCSFPHSVGLGSQESLWTHHLRISGTGVLIQKLWKVLASQSKCFLGEISALQSCSIRSSMYCSKAKSVFPDQELIIWLWEWIWFVSIWK